MKLNEIDIPRIKDTESTKAVKLLKILLSGIPIKHPDGYGDMYFGKTTDGSFQLLCVVNDKEDIIGLDISLQQFLKLAEQIPDSEIDVAIMNIVLTKNNLRH